MNRAQIYLELAHLFGELASIESGALPRDGARAPAAPGRNAGTQAAVASDADLDGQYGDKQVKFDPKRWQGQSYKGANYSECPSDYLLVLAEFLEWSAANPREGKEKYAAYDLRDAGLARGFARRNEGKPLTRKAPVDEYFGGSAAGGDQDPSGGIADDDIPFSASRACEW